MGALKHEREEGEIYEQPDCESVGHDAASGIFIDQRVSGAVLPRAFSADVIVR